MSAIYCAVCLTVPEQYQVTAQFETRMDKGFLGVFELCRALTVPNPGIVYKSLIYKGFIYCATVPP